MNLVTLRDVGVAYDGYEALQHVDLEIAKNDFLGVIGPNGGGKTTLVKAILGTVPHTGEVRLAPELFRDKERLIGYMPQLSDFDRTFPISVLEVVLSGLQGHKGIFSRYTKADRAKALDLLETAGVADTARNPIGEVSGGQMQRALLCRAVISDPKLLILDEPANFVDNKFENELYRTLHELNRRMAIVMVSHDIGTISSVVKEIVCVNRRVHRHRVARAHSPHGAGASSGRLLLRPRIKSAFPVGGTRLIYRPASIRERLCALGPIPEIGQRLISSPR